MINSKVALVTGASRGIGRGIALRLASEGYSIIINSRTADPNNLEKGAYEVKNTIEQANGKAWVFRADISLADERAALIDYAVNEIGRVDLLVNNAGVEPPIIDMLEESEECFDSVISINLKGPYFITQQIAKKMIEWQQSGLMETPRIVFISSVQAYMSGGGSIYSITKAALHMAMKNYACRLGKEKINVYEIAPGVIKSDMTNVHAEKIERKIANDWLLTERWGTLEDVAKLVSAIGRGDLDYSTGSTFEVGGGLGVMRL